MSASIQQTQHNLTRYDLSIGFTHFHWVYAPIAFVLSFKWFYLLFLFHLSYLLLRCLLSDASHASASLHLGGEYGTSAATL
jgi:hypothetical protein